MTNVFIGAGWPYASGPRHLGHLAGAYLPADILARYHRLAGDDVLFVSGSDEHGTPITVAADRRGVAPAEYADNEHQRIKATFDRVGISFDNYSRTTSDTHRRVVHEVFGELHRRGLITEEDELGAWCEHEQRSLPDRYLTGTCPACTAPGARGDQCDTCGATYESTELGDATCAVCGRPASFVSRPQLFLRLDLLTDSIRSALGHIEGRRPWAKSEASAALAAGLRRRSITRDLGWGVPVPVAGWDDRRLYVWFEAVIGYLSASVEWSEKAGEPDRWKDFWTNPGSHHLYVVGKDNVWFHALWWPAILAGARPDLHLPDDVVASHHLTERGEQASTGRGHGTTVEEALERVGVDELRHALCASSPESADSDFTWDRAAAATRTGLLGSIANPAHRVVTLVWTRFGGRIDLVRRPALELAEKHLDSVGTAIAAARFRDALAAIHGIGAEINRLLGATEPWKQDDAQASRTLADLLPLVDALGVAAWPVVPGVASRIRTTLGRSATPARWAVEHEPARIRTAPEPPLRANP